MGHARRSRCAVPMFFVRREPDDVARPDCLDRSALTLNPSAAGGDDKRLTQGMRVPRGSGTRLKCDAGAGDAGGLWRREQPINPDPAGKIIFGTFARWL